MQGQGRERAREGNEAKGGHPLPPTPRMAKDLRVFPPGCVPLHATPSQLLTIAGQEHSPVHQVLQGLPEQLAGAASRIQVHEALQYRQQLG